jgi:hypothetical protein
VRPSAPSIRARSSAVCGPYGIGSSAGGDQRVVGIRVEQVIDRSLVRRPDLAARLAVLRAREADVRKARADFYPKVKLNSSIGGNVGRYTFGGSSPIDYGHPEYGAFLNLDLAML